jgi:hypothetical protein
MTEIIFKDNSIQTGHRIKIPKAIIDTLDLKVKQKITIRFDVDKKNLVVDVAEKTEAPHRSRRHRPRRIVRR